MVRLATTEGVMSSLTPRGGISLKGDAGAVSQWAAVLKTRKPELIAYLTTEKIVTDWLDRIGEDDPAVFLEVLTRCRQDPEALTYFLVRAGGYRSIV